MINWGLAQGNGFQNALATGMQMGAQAREAADRREYSNALLAVMEQQDSPTGTPGIGDGVEQQRKGMDRSQAMAVVARQNPQLYMQMQEREQARQQKQIEADLTKRAMGGDADALKQMATVNFDKWKALDGQQREAIQQEAEVHANAAMDVLRLPPQQRAGAVMAFANRLGSQEIAQLADLPPQELEAALRAAIVEAGMVKELHAMERPDYQAVPYESTLVNVRDPRAVASFAGGGNGGRQVQRTGKDASGRTVVQYTDGTIEYAEGGTAGNGGGTFP